MYNLNMEESEGGRSSSYVSWAKGLVGICTQGSVLGPILFVLQTLTPAFLTTSSTQQDITAARYISLNLTSDQ